MAKEMYLLALYFLISSLKIETGQAQPTKEVYEFNESIQGSLKLHRIPETWGTARLRCHYEGAVLASPTNESLVVAIKALLAKEDTIDTIFTGIHSQFSPGNFVSVEGVPLNEMDLEWAPGKPGVTGEDCLVLNANKLADVPCSKQFSYICYKRATEQESHGCEKGYKYEDRTKSCYKVHPVGRTWREGYMTCAAEGGHLAIINSELEAQVIRELLQSYPAERMFADYTHVASIGYLDWGERGSWWTIHGQGLSEAGYAKWENNGPDNKKSQFCGGVNRSGKLNDIWCDQGTFPVICEMSVKPFLIPADF